MSGTNKPKSRHPAAGSGAGSTASSPTGILAVDKPVGLTSMRAVEDIRRRVGGAKTGHAGTLDPLASGVLVVAIGRATRHVERLMATDKRYRAVIDLSAFTTTDDREGERVEVEVAQPPSDSVVRDAMARLVGEIQQRPPAFSAVKIGGQRAYRLARKGEAMELRARPVVIHGLELIELNWPLLELDLHCGKGVYVRSLARDLGELLGTGGHCASIRRTAVGPFTIDMAVPLMELPEHIGADDLLSPEVAIRMVETHGSPAQPPLDTPDHD